MRKHAESEHGEVSSRYNVEIFAHCMSVHGAARKEPAKKQNRPTLGYISSFFGSKVPYKKGDEQQKFFLEDLVLLIAKGYYPLSSVDSLWLRRFSTGLMLV